MIQTTLRKPVRGANFINLIKGTDQKKHMANLILKVSERLNAFPSRSRRQEYSFSPLTKSPS